MRYIHETPSFRLYSMMNCQQMKSLFNADDDDRLATESEDWLTDMFGLSSFQANRMSRLQTVGFILQQYNTIDVHYFVKIILEHSFDCIFASRDQI